MPSLKTGQRAHRRAAAALASIATVAGFAATAAPAGAAPTTAAAAPAARTAGVTFSDISTTPFKAQINWSADQEISTGWQVGSTYQYRPYEPVRRDQMVTFLYRLVGRPTSTPPTTSNFTDVPPGTVFYREINWAYDWGISAGVTGPNATVFEPTAVMTRSEMASFLYQLADSPVYTPPAVSPFSDIKTSDPRYKEICWMRDAGISTGWTVTGGKVEYRPTQSVLRDVMATFLYRFAQAGDPTVMTVRQARADWVFAALMDEINLYRSRNAIPVMTEDFTLDDWSQAWAERMASTGSTVRSGYAVTQEIDERQSAESSADEVARIIVGRWAANAGKKAQLLDPATTTMSVGVVRDAASTWWTSAMFNVGPAAAAGVAGAHRAPHGRIADILAAHQN